MFYFGLHRSEQLRVAPGVDLSEEQQAELTKLACSKRTSVGSVATCTHRALAAQGLQNKDIAEQLGVGRVQVSRWRERDMPRGAPPVKVDVQKLVKLTTQSQPEAATYWSTREMGGSAGRQRQHRDAALAGQRPEAAHRARIQGLARPKVRREA